MHRVTLCVRCPPLAKYPHSLAGRGGQVCWCDIPSPFSQAFLGCLGVRETGKPQTHTLQTHGGGQKPGVTLVRERPHSSKH